VARFCREDGSARDGIEEQPLAGDASTRQYGRLEAPDGSTAIIVRYPGDSREVFERDMAVLDWCERQHLIVPRRFGVWPESGICCFEDWGEEDAEGVLCRLSPKEREALALNLVDPLAVLAALPPGGLPAWNPPLGEERLRAELEGCEEWFFGRFLGREPGAGVSRWLDELAHQVAGHPLRVCHRDYHLNNLFFLSGGAVGILDIQDILIGPDTYDAASLVGDRAFPEIFGRRYREEWLEVWARKTGAAPGWETRLDQAEAQRGFKVLGTFARLGLQRSRAYTRWLPPLARRMADLAELLGAPRSLGELLLDWHMDGEP